MKGKYSYMIQTFFLGGAEGPFFARQKYGGHPGGVGNVPNFCERKRSKNK